MSTARDRKAWSQILELYHREFPYLWDKSNSMYNNKKMRNDAYKVLTQIYRDNFDINASIDALKKKLENMRTTYFRELRKVKKSIQCGADEAYEPSLWYYEQLNFLANLYEPNGRYSTKPQRPTVTDPLKTEETTFDTSDSELDYEASTSQEKDDNKTDYRKKHKVTVLKKREHQNTATKHETMKSEDCEVMGRSIGLQLRDISDKQLTIASKLISDTIYFAKLNRLSEKSHIDIGTVDTLPSMCTICAAQVGRTEKSTN